MDEVRQDEGEERDCMKHADDMETETKTGTESETETETEAETETETETGTETGTEAETETELCVGGCNFNLTFINILPFDIITHYHHLLCGEA